MSDTITTERPKAKRRLRKIDAAMRLRIEQAIQSMIDTLDALDALAEDREPEDEGSDDEKEGDGDPDDEPSLGASEFSEPGRGMEPREQLRPAAAIAPSLPAIRTEVLTGPRMMVWAERSAGVCGRPLLFR